MDAGKSLRQKRGAGKLKISGPTLISAPKSATSSTINLKEAAAAQTPRRPSTAGAGGSSRRDGLMGMAKPGLPTGGPDSTRPRQRTAAANDQTTDLVKRRYSTRFATQQDYSQPPVMPDMPSMPRRFAFSDTDEMGDGGKKITVDPAVFNDPNFDPETYVSTELRNASENEISLFRRELQKMKHNADTKIQQNVYQNRTQFIKISKEADRLKAEIRTLRGLMGELNNAMGSVTVTNASSGSDSFSSGGRSNRGNRSSVANLEALWNSHLQELWRRVEGSQKYLPAISGRHVVYESSRWVELNSATWKPRRKVHIILLNDHLLLATDKKRPEGQRDAKEKQQTAQLVALKCWPLQDVQIADIAARVAPGTGEAPSSSHSVNIRVGSESLTFATANKEGHEKLSLLSNFRKSSEDLRRKLDAENLVQGRNKELDNGFTSPLLKTTFGDVLAGSKSDFLVEVDGVPQSLRWVEMQIDELDIDSALQKHEEAITRIEKLRSIVQDIKSNAAIQKGLTKRLDERAAKLALTIARNLLETHSWMTATEKNVLWLFRLGYHDRAREAYLEARSSIIQKRVRQVIFDGDLHLYIYQISFIYFSIIKHSALIFQACFPASMLSACVKWAKGHVDDFNSLLQRQLSSVDSESETYKACLKTAHEHAATLSEVGLDFKDLIWVKVQVDAHTEKALKLHGVTYYQAMRVFYQKCSFSSRILKLYITTVHPSSTNIPKCTQLLTITGQELIGKIAFFTAINMPPKGATKTASAGMSEEVYFFYAALRIVMTQLGTAPNWDLIAEAIGGNRTGHTLYCRIDKLKKTAVPGFGQDIPDLEQLITDAVASGRINSKAKRPAADAESKPAKKPKKKSAAKEEECVVKQEGDGSEDIIDEAM